MPRYRLTIEYAGTRYSGWQVQANARTVQGELIRAFREAHGAADVELQGAGRTDAGVHALQQVAHLDLAQAAPAEMLRRRVNDLLPADVNVLSIVPVPHRFHARHDAILRSYLYQIARRRTAFAKPFVWWVKDDLDSAAMASTAARLTGLRDFRSFTDADPEAGSTLVHVERIDVQDDGDLVLVRVSGSHFLWKMVRRIVGVLVEVGRGRLTPADIESFLEAPSPVPARVTAPASGLFLERVVYAGDPPLMPLRPVTPLPRWTAAPPSPSAARDDEPMRRPGRTHRGRPHRR